MTLIQQKWCDLVKGYTACNLTYTSDKLVAIAGMAQMISRTTQCQYVAGLWRKDLEHQLLWKVKTPAPAAVRDGTRGPSWSWPSVDGAITWEHWQGGFHYGVLSEIEWLARIESCNVETITPDPFGQVASGSLVISGPLVVLKISDYKPPKPRRGGGLLEACDHRPDIFWDSQEFHEQFGSKRTHAIWKYKVYRAGPTRSTSSYGDNIFFMPIRIMHHDYMAEEYESPMLCGLLLLPCTRTRGTYRRVGQLTLSSQNHQKAFEEGERPLQSGTEITDRRLYQSVHENGEYTIVIV
ncbi:hypothetical protein LTR17_025486 [Elasticomyces elasticus]|nr:hypothetical protein LTR17_025486 [Elasticomyces elasticus]